MAAPSIPTSRRTPGTLSELRGDLKQGFVFQDFPQLGAGSLALLAQSIDYRLPTGTASPATGNSLWAALWLPQGMLVSNLTFLSVGGGATMTHWGFSLVDLNGNQLATSADQGSAAWPASTPKTLAMTTAYRIPQSGLFYAGVGVAFSVGAISLSALVTSNTGLESSALSVANDILDTTDVYAGAFPNPLMGLTVANMLRHRIWVGVS